MNEYAKAYASTDTYSGVAYADPHSLITRMFDGAIKRIAQARGHIERGEIAQKGSTIGMAIDIIANLDACLDHSKGAELAANLSNLYQYMIHTLVQANIHNDQGKLEEVIRLIQEIKSAWVKISPQDDRKAG